MLRRDFLSNTGLALGALSTMNGIAASSAAAESNTIAAGDWPALRNLFPLTRDYIQLSTFLLASHPRPVLLELTNGYLVPVARVSSGVASVAGETAILSFLALGALMASGWGR